MLGYDDFNRGDPFGEARYAIVLSVETPGGRPFTFFIRSIRTRAPGGAEGISVLQPGVLLYLVGELSGLD